MINQEIKVLDRGFVKLIDFMGSDARIAEAARVSTASERKEIRSLIRYLIKHEHWSPVEFCEVVLHCKMPIFVARQWVRHRSASINECSGRYRILDTEFYIPDYDRVQLQATDNKQGSGETACETVQRDFIESCGDIDNLAKFEYDKWIDQGIARELARINLPVSTYTEWYWKIDLRNLLHFLKLRTDEHAQYEIREYANAIEEIVKELFPVTYEAWVDYEKDAVKLSAQQHEAIKMIVDRYLLKQDWSDLLNKREAEELRKWFE